MNKVVFINKGTASFSVTSNAKNVRELTIQRRKIMAPDVENLVLAHFGFTACPVEDFWVNRSSE